MPKTCHVCQEPLPLDGWGSTARRLDSGQYIHYACIPIDSHSQDNAHPRPKPLAALKLPTPEADEAYISIRQAAQLLGVSASTIRARIRAGHLPAKRLKWTTTVRLSRADVLDQLEDIATDRQPSRPCA